MTTIRAFLAMLARTVVLLLAAASAALGLVGQWGRVDPRLDLINHAAPAWLGLGVLAIVGWRLLGSKGRVASTFAGIGLTANLWTCGPEWWAAALQGRARPSAETIKVIQFNLWGGNRDPEGTARWLRAQNADFLVLQEAGAADPRIWERAASVYPYVGACPDPRSCSVLILSKRPPIRQGYFTSRLAKTEVGGWAYYPSPLGEFAIGALHLRRPLPYGHQLAEVAELPAQIKRLDPASAIVAGDLNAVPWSFALKRFDKTLGLKRRSRAIFSWPSANRPEMRGLALPFLPIDHIYAGDAWRTVAISRGPPLGSDHYPVIVILTRG